VDMLQRAVRAAAASGDADAVATAAECAVPGDIDDDMAILVVQSSPSELASVERTFPAEPIMVSEARRLAAETFRTWGMDSGQAELACLLVSEVATNAVLHASVTPSPDRKRNFGFEPLMVPAPVGAAAGTVPAGSVPASPVPASTGAGRPPSRSSGRPPAAARKTAVPAQAVAVPAGAGPVGAGPVRAVPAGTSAWPDELGEAGPAAESGPREFAVRLRRGATAVWVEVFDPDLRLPRIRTAGETDEGGRGLYLVEQLATRWGSRPTPEGKAVWFEMPRSGSQS